MKAVVDEISDGNVVLHVGEDEKEVVIGEDEVDSGMNLREGDWLDVEWVKNQLRIIKKDEKTTESRRERIQKKLDRLRNKGNRKGR